MKPLYIWILTGFFGLLCFTPSTVGGKKFLRCELSRQLLEKYKFNKTFLSNWICLIEHESNLDTQKVTEMRDGSAKYGLFQISSKNYCSVNRKGGACNNKCSDFLDNNIDDDVACAKLIFELEGFKHWSGWSNSCKNQINLPQLAVLCRDIHAASATAAARRLFRLN